MNLTNLKPKQSAVITSIAWDAFYSPPHLMALGLLPGTSVTLLRRAPLGDPIEIQVRQTRLGLRRAEAVSVEVEVK